MSLVQTLLRALVTADGDAVVIHSGDAPYVDAGGEGFEISNKPLTPAHVRMLLEQLLPAESQQTFNLLGSIRYECPPVAEHPNEQFTVVAFRDAGDVWVELRRERAGARQNDALVIDDLDVPDRDEIAAGDPSLILPDFEELWPDQVPDGRLLSPRKARDFSTADLELDDVEDEAPRTFDRGHAARPAAPRFGTAGRRETPPPQFDDGLNLDGLDEGLSAATARPPRRAAPPPPQFDDGLNLDDLDEGLFAPVARPPRHVVSSPPNFDDGPTFDHLDEGLSAPPPPPERRIAPPQPVAADRVPPERRIAPPPQPVAIAPPPQPVATNRVPPAADDGLRLDDLDKGLTRILRDAPAEEQPDEPAAQHAAVVLPMSKSPFQTEVPRPVADTSPASLDRLLRIVSARGGSTLYVVAGERPSMRIDGEIQPLGDESPLTSDDTEMLLLGVAPERTHEALRAANRTEWIEDLEGVGRVRCVTFRDQRGAGGIFRIMASRAATMEQLGLTREMRALALEPEGLLLVTGPRSSGKSTLISAYVDLINQTRRDHVITIEDEIQVVHQQHGSIISQREVRGTPREQLAAAETALREDPDVLVIEDLHSDAIVRLALDASKSGRLVIAGLPGRTAADAVDRILDQYQPGERGHAQMLLAYNLRGIIVQALVRKPGGGRLAARGLLLNTPAVAGLIAEGKTSQLSLAIDAGQKAGMISINATLAGLVQSGAVDIREAYRHAGDRRGFVALLKKNGVETILLERLG